MTPERLKEIQYGYVHLMAEYETCEARLEVEPDKREEIEERMRELLKVWDAVYHLIPCLGGFPALQELEAQNYARLVHLLEGYDED